MIFLNIDDDKESPTYGKLIPADGMKSIGRKQDKNRIYSYWKKGDRKNPFTISRSGVSEFLDCKRCFYLGRVMGLRDMKTLPLTLANTNDRQVKKEFDKFRDEEKSHPVMIENNLDAVPYKDERVKIWTTGGIKFENKELNFKLTGKIDDVWVIKNSKPAELIIVDYKTQAKRGKVDKRMYFVDPFHKGYKFQLEFYRYLFIKNDLTVYPKGYLLVYNAIQERNEFGKEMKFERVLIDYNFEKKPEYFDKIIGAMKEVMDSVKIPESNPSCLNCAYIKCGSQLLKTKKMEKKEALKIVQRDGLELQNLPAHFKKDREVVLEAVKEHPSAIMDADESLMKDKEIILLGVDYSGHLLEFADDSLREDKEFVLEAVKINGYALEYADDSLKKDKEVVLEAVKATRRDHKYNIDVLEIIDESLRNDPDILAMVNKNK